MPDNHNPTSDEDFAFQWGRFTEAVKQLSVRFDKLEKSMAKRCTDCAYPAQTKEIEKRVRFIEVKMAGIAAVAAVVSQFIVKHI